jgi:hypothetical protein
MLFPMLLTWLLSQISLPLLFLSPFRRLLFFVTLSHSAT